MSAIVVVGSVGVDTLHLPSGSHTKVPGGAAWYGSVAASMYHPVALLGIVGEDFPKTHLEQLTKRNIDLGGLEIVPGKTFHWEGRYSDNLASRETLTTELNVFADFRPTVPGAFKNARYVFLGNIDPELQLNVLQQIDQPQMVVADTMNFWIEGKPKELARLLEHVNLLVINEEEARQLAETYNLVDAAKRLQAMGPEVVVIKRGEYGALLFEKNEIFCAPAYPVQTVVDPTGAGDTFAGALIGFLASRTNGSPHALRQAVIVGSAAASYCVQAVGTQGLLPIGKMEVEQRYREFANLVHFGAEQQELRS